MNGPAWRELSDAKLAATRPYLLHCDGLSDRDMALVRRDFLEAALTAIRAVAKELQRVPTADEIELLRAALARHFNLVRIPALRSRSTLH